MRRKILPFILGGAMSIAAIGPAAASEHNTPETTMPGPCTVVGDIDRGGAAALVALVQAVVQLNAGVNACNIDVDILNNSLNNLLRNADVDVLNNILNNSPILSNDAIDVNVFENDILNGLQINVLGGGVNITLTDPA